MTAPLLVGAQVDALRVAANVCLTMASELEENSAAPDDMLAGFADRLITVARDMQVEASYLREHRNVEDEVDRVVFRSGTL